MARVLVTGSADGLGRAAAQTLLNDGHQVVVHARTRDRLTAVRDLLDRGAAAVVGDLSDLQETRGVAGQVNRLGRMDAVIHNAGVSPAGTSCRSTSSLRTCSPSLGGIDWRGRRSPGSYPDSKLLVTTLAVAVARSWAEVFSNAVDPGWVPTKMGGAGAPDDLRLGHLTQEWLATSEDPDARTSGGYWHHQRRIQPHPAVGDRRFQGQLLDDLARFTATRLV
jgi:NAD(P)-dependent dehydrogenase (short-subunit alcohol dehydrogenase family)